VGPFVESKSCEENSKSENPIKIKYNQFVTGFTK
jgi:hypothetical protein